MSNIVRVTTVMRPGAVMDRTCKMLEEKSIARRTTSNKIHSFSGLDAYAHSFFSMTEEGEVMFSTDGRAKRNRDLVDEVTQHYALAGIMSTAESQGYAISDVTKNKEGSFVVMVEA